MVSRPGVALVASHPQGNRVGPSGPLFSAFAVAYALSVIGGFLGFLREPPLGDFYAEWTALFFFSLGAALLALTLPRRCAINPVLFAVPVTLALLLVLQFVSGRYAYWQTPLFWLGYLLLATLALALGQGIRAAGLASETVNRLAWALAITGLLNSLAQIVQTIFQVEALAPYVLNLLNCRPYGNLGQPNHAATLAWLGIGSVLYLQGDRRLPSFLATPTLAILLVGAALSASRMNMLYLPITAAIVALLPAWPAPNRRARLVTVAMLGIGFVFASVSAAAALEALGAGCSSGLGRLTDRGEAGFVVRLDLWRQAINVWLTRPWLGAGAYGFAPTVYAIESIDLHRPLDFYAHNVVLQVLAEFGLAGAAALAGVAFFLLRWLWRHRGQLGAADALLVLVLAFLCTHSMLEFPLWYSHFLLLFGLAAGLLVRPEWVGKRVEVSLRLPLMAAACVLLASAGWLFDDYRKLDRLYWLEEHRRAFSAAPTGEVRALLDEAAADVRLFRVQADHFAGAGEPINRDDLQRKIATTDRLMRHSPNPVTVGRRIALAILDKDEETARWHLRRLLGFFPGHAETLAESLRLFVEHRPEEFSALAPILDEELARRPKRRW